MSYYSIRDLLVIHGVNILTGEADKYSMRMLCDLNRTGVRTVCDYFGINESPGMFNANWNSKVHGQDAVASFMLPKAAIRDLAEFCAFHYMNVFAIACEDNGCTIFTKELMAKYKENDIDLYNVKRNYAYQEPITVTGMSIK